MKKIYPRTGDKQTVYLNAVIKDPQIEVGDYTIYNDLLKSLSTYTFPLFYEEWEFQWSVISFDEHDNTSARDE